MNTGECRSRPSLWAKWSMAVLLAMILSRPCLAFGLSAAPVIHPDSPAGEDNTLSRSTAAEPPTRVYRIDTVFLVDHFPPAEIKVILATNRGDLSLAASYHDLLSRYAAALAEATEVKGLVLNLSKLVFLVEAVSPQVLTCRQLKDGLPPGLERRVRQAVLRLCQAHPQELSCLEPPQLPARYFAYLGAAERAEVIDRLTGQVHLIVETGELYRLIEKLAPLKDDLFGYSFPLFGMVFIDSYSESRKRPFAQWSMDLVLIHELAHCTYTSRHEDHNYWYAEEELFAIQHSIAYARDILLRQESVSRQDKQRLQQLIESEERHAVNLKSP